MEEEQKNTERILAEEKEKARLAEKDRVDKEEALQAERKQVRDRSWDKEQEDHGQAT